jgi:hypothetical protein
LAVNFAVELTSGSQVWFDGEVWTITDFGGGTVTLNASQLVRTVSITTLATSASPMTESSETSKDRELVPIVLGMLDSRALSELERRAEHVRAVLDAPCSRVGHRIRAIERKAYSWNNLPPPGHTGLCEPHPHLRCRTKSAALPRRVRMNTCGHRIRVLVVCGWLNRLQQNGF